MKKGKMTQNGGKWPKMAEKISAATTPVVPA